MGILQVAVGGIVVTHVRTIRSIQRQGGVHPHISGTIHRFDKPACPIVPGILQGSVGYIIVTQVWMVGAIQRQRDVLAHVSDTVYPLDKPDGPLKMSVSHFFRVTPVVIEAIADVWPAGGIQSQRGIPTYCPTIVYCFDPPSRSVRIGVSQFPDLMPVTGYKVIDDVWPVRGVQRQGGEQAGVVTHRLDQPTCSVEMSIPDPIPRAVTDVWVAAGVQGQRGIKTPVIIHHLDVPGRPIIVGVLYTTIVTIVTDVRPSVRIQRQGGEYSYVPDTVHRLGEPGRPVVVSVFEVAVGRVVVTDVRPAARVQRKGKAVAHIASTVYRLGEPGGSVEVSIPQLLTPPVAGVKGAITDMGVCPGI